MPEYERILKQPFQNWEENNKKLFAPRKQLLLFPHGRLGTCGQSTKLWENAVCARPAEDSLPLVVVFQRLCCSQRERRLQEGVLCAGTEGLVHFWVLRDPQQLRRSLECTTTLRDGLQIDLGSCRNQLMNWGSQGRSWAGLVCVKQWIPCGRLRPGEPEPSRRLH